MGLWDALRGASRPKQPDLDRLFALPSAALSLDAALGFQATGTGSVCYRAAEGLAAGATQQEAAELVDLDGPPPQSRVDEYGYTWLTVRRDPGDVSGLVTDLHAVNSALEAQGFGPGLLCSVVSFVRPAEGPDKRAYLVYLYKQGSFYPFCPNGLTSRDDLVERQVRDSVEHDLVIEPDRARWMPLWGIDG